METVPEPGTLPLVARGGQTDIYEFGAGKVLRVPRREEDYDRIRYEYAVYSSIESLNIATPKAYELLDLHGVPVIAMERLYGSSMLDQLRKRPCQIRKKSIQLARMHLDLLSIRAPTSLRNAKEKARHCMLGSEVLTAGVKNTLLGILQSLPDGDRLCHGDFHPGNIITGGGKDVLIDWSGAAHGDPVSDIAHTYILLKVVPRIPSVGLALHLMQLQLGQTMARSYLNTVARLDQARLLNLSRWVLVKAAERTYYGLPSEKVRLMKYIDWYLQRMGPGIDEDRFYARI